MRKQYPKNAPGAIGKGEFWFRGRHATGVMEYRDLRENSRNLEPGIWAVVAEFEGPIHAWRMQESHACPSRLECVMPITEPRASRTESEVTSLKWGSTLDQGAYEAAVRSIHLAIASGDLEQINLCRVLSADLYEPPDAGALHVFLQQHHPAPYAGYFDFPGGHVPVWLVSASPELAGKVESNTLSVAPIKGTAQAAEKLLVKDYLENQLVTRSVAQELTAELGGTPEIELFQIEEYRSLVQLLSTITVDLAPRQRQDLHWPHLLGSLLPPLSVTGVPRAAATKTIAALEPTRRGLYCGAMGWVASGEGRAELGATIRSFWWAQGRLHYGTGAGITAASDPAGEWDETELKAESLLDLLARVGAHG